LLEQSLSIPEWQVLGVSESDRAWAAERAEWDNFPQLFNTAVRMAANSCEAPICLLSVLNSSHKIVKFSWGLTIGSVPRPESFCAYTIQVTSNTAFVVEDALLDLRFSSSPLMSGNAGIRFYCGVPITIDGINIGSLCVMDTKPRAAVFDHVRKLIRIRDFVAKHITVPKRRWYHRLFDKGQTIVV
jgi:GAF domain-containing protein